MTDDKKAAAADVSEDQPAAGDSAKRVRTIEKRHGKSFMEVMCDVHDHVFGGTVEPTENAAVEAGDPDAAQTSGDEGDQGESTG